MQEILARLDEITEQDGGFIQSRSSRPVTISVEQLFAYGQRFDKRQKLHDELRNLVLEPIED